MDTRTPVAEIGEGARFRHWRYGQVTVIYKRAVVSGKGKPLVQLGLMVGRGEIPDEWRPNAKIHVED